MELMIQELVSSIRREGIDAANAEAESIIAEAKKKAEKDTRKKEVTMAIEHASELLNEYIKDYGSYSYDGKKLNDTSDFFWPSRLWHYFL